MNILVLKETKAGEKRAALLPSEVKKLIAAGHSVFVENGAGNGVQINNQSYQAAGAIIRDANDDNFTALFKDIDIIVRVKKADPTRELQEIAAIQENTIMIGCLDPEKKDSDHIIRYRSKNIAGYSLDYIDVPASSPMNLLAQMSTLTGKITLLEGIEKYNGEVNKFVLIGYGNVGKAALQEACSQKIASTVFCTRQSQQEEIESLGAKALLLNKNAKLEASQHLVLNEIKQADVVITTARSRVADGVESPLLIPTQSLNQMKPGAVVIDLTITEGGNVEGSELDKTITTEQGVIVTNQSGYPKKVPLQASKMWSQATYQFIVKLSEDKPLAETARVC